MTRLRNGHRGSAGLRLVLLVALVGALVFAARADEIFLEDRDTPVSGKITYEDDEVVEIQTQDYGSLTFKKYRVKEIRRQFGGTTTYSSSGSGTAQPGQASPWGAAPQGQSPFGGPSPAGQAPGAVNPFGTGATPATGPGQPGVPGMASTDQPPATPTPLATIPTLPSALEVDDAPPIPPGFDGVLFGMQEGFVVEIRKGPQDPWEPASNSSPLLVGNAVRTGEGKVKIRLRGRDTLRVPPRSHVILVALSTDASQVTLEVRNGSLWTEVAPRARATDFKVVTPDLTAGVRGTLFKTTVQPGAGSRVAVFENEVEVESQKTGASTTVPENMAVVVNPEGQIEPPKPVLPTEYDEWAAWDEWALDFYKNVAVFSPVGAPILQGMAQQIAQDNAQWASTMNEANRQIAQNKYEDLLKYYADAFLRFAQDTGHIPDPDTEGWQALVENTGNWEGWNGPYLQQQSLPPMDIYQRPVHYAIRYNSSGGNIHGLVYSEGLNRRDDDGRSASDDIIAYVMYYQLPKIASNPQYQSRPQTAAP